MEQIERQDKHIIDWEFSSSKEPMIAYSKKMYWKKSLSFEGGNFSLQNYTSNNNACVIIFGHIGKEILNFCA